MTSLNTDNTTAVVSGKKARLFDLLIAIIKDDPKEIPEVHYREAKRLLLTEGYEDYLDDALTKIVALEYGVAIKQVRTPTKQDIQQHIASTKTRRASEDKKTEQAKTIIGARIAKIIVLDLIMPNGKALRECTGYECTKFGGLFVAIGKRVGAAKKVGDVLTEDDLSKLNRASK